MLGGLAGVGAAAYVGFQTAASTRTTAVADEEAASSAIIRCALIRAIDKICS